MKYHHRALSLEILDITRKLDMPMLLASERIRLHQRLLELLEKRGRLEQMMESEYGASKFPPK